MNKTNTILLIIIIILLVLAGGISYLNKKSDYFDHKNTDYEKTIKANNETQTPPHLITPDQIDQMEILMENNSKSLQGLQAYRFEKDNIGMTHIRFYVYLNGIRTDESIYHFKSNGTISSVTNEINTDITPNISTIPKISEDQAIVIASKKIKNESLVANKEFWNKNMGKPGEKYIVLVWRVRPIKNSPSYLIIDAQTG